MAKTKKRILYFDGSIDAVLHADWFQSAMKLDHPEVDIEMVSVWPLEDDIPDYLASLAMEDWDLVVIDMYAAIVALDWCKIFWHALSSRNRERTIRHGIFNGKPIYQDALNMIDPEMAKCRCLDYAMRYDQFMSVVYQIMEL
jgi:hypothetical protein